MKSREKEKDGMSLIQSLIPPIISLAVFVLVSLMMATKPGINEEVDDFFWIQTAGSVVCLMLTFVVWVPTGERIAWNKKRVIANKKLYDYRANYIISKQMFTKGAEFVKYKNEARRKEIIQEILSDGERFKNNGNIDYWIYELYTKKEKTEEEKTRIDNVMKELSTAQQELVKKLATAEIKFEHLQLSDMIMGRSKSKGIVNKDNSKLYEIGFAGIKSAWGLMASCFTYFIVIEPNDSFGYQQAIMIIMWFFTFLNTIYSAIRIGYNAIYVKKTSYNIKQGLLCGEFMTYAGVPPEDMDPPAEDGNEET